MTALLRVPTVLHTKEELIGVLEKLKDVKSIVAIVDTKEKFFYFLVAMVIN